MHGCSLQSSIGSLDEYRTVNCTYEEFVGDVAGYMADSVAGGDGSFKFGECVADDGTRYDIHANDLAESLTIKSDERFTLTLKRSPDELNLHMWTIVRVERLPS